VSSTRLSGALENCKLQIAFALGRQSAEIQAKQIGFADPFAVKEAPLVETQHSQYQSIADQFESWNQELMNLPTRCCYVKLQEKAAVRITSLKVPQPKVAQRELGAVLGEYKRRYQRSDQQAKTALQDVADALPFRTGFARSKARLLPRQMRQRRSPTGFTIRLPGKPAGNGKTSPARTRVNA
jgi:hypothetical protein